MPYLQKIATVITLIVVLSTSCKTTNMLYDKQVDTATEQLDSVFFDTKDYVYKIRKNDKITISLWGQDEMSVGSTFGIYNSNEVYGKWLMVDHEGNIEVPQMGVIKVEGLTTVDLKDTLRSFYAQTIVKPVVDVKILNKEISVVGEVRDPQIIPVDKDKITLLEMISACKGFDAYANMKEVKVVRELNDTTYVANIDLSKSDAYNKRNIQVVPGDIIIVPSLKNKNFDRRVTTIIPFTTAITALAILIGLL